ncbi:pilus assembly protein CpaB [Dyella jiangningensis]|jgi:pilus assembly protein CpaB|nr:pilus assembly protein CpaB [Dyella jiangningensis]
MPHFARIAAILLVIVATLLALAAFSMGRRASANASANTSHAPTLSVLPKPVTMHVVVAARRLPAGQRIDASQLRLAEMSTRPDDSFVSIDALAGQLPRVDIPEGTVITPTLLSNPVAMQLAAGERAIAVPVDETTGVGSRVLPGDYVDVVLTLKSGEPASSFASTKEVTQSRLLASRLRVLAYGPRDLPAVGVVHGDASAASTKSERNSDAPTRTAVLAVPVADIDPLVLGAQSGKLSLALRHPGDDGVPTPLLFPTAQPVLSPVANLTPEQRAWLAAPENRAYAGIDERGLAGTLRAIAPTPSLRHTSAPTIEIVRGAESSLSQAQRTAIR